jgi:TonB family protein
MGDSASGRGGYTRTMRLPTLAGVVLAMAVQPVPPQDEPARVTAVALPEPPPVMTVGAGEVVLEAVIDTDGNVEQIDKLRATAPFTDLVASAVEGWRFVPATIVKDGRPEQVASRVLVVAFYRPPAMYMGATIGEPIRDVGRPSGEAPSIGSLQAPPYPPNSRGDGTVLLEVELSAGGVKDVKVLRSGGGFDEPAIDTVRQWRFMPPRVAGPSRHYAYVILGFREPVAGRTPRN